MHWNEQNSGFPCPFRPSLAILVSARPLSSATFSLCTTLRGSGSVEPRTEKQVLVRTNRFLTLLPSLSLHSPCYSLASFQPLATT